jgi:hypothetical protein
MLSQTSVTGYFPKGVWYDVFGFLGDPFPGGRLPSPAVVQSQGESVTLSTPLNYTNLHVLEGTAFARHEKVCVTQDSQCFLIHWPQGVRSRHARGLHNDPAPKCPEFVRIRRGTQWIRTLLW